MAVSLGAIAGCSSPTAVIVTVEADATVAAAADGWSFEVIGPSGARAIVPLEEPPVFPRRFTVTPSMAGGAERFSIEGRVRDGGRELGLQRVTTSFVDGAVTHVRLSFTAGCDGIACAVGTTCDGGRCVDACVIPGGSDGEMRRVPCEVADAGMDAGSDAGVGDAPDDTPTDAFTPPPRVPATLAYDFATTTASSTPACVAAGSALSAAAFELSLLNGAVVDPRGATSSGDLVLEGGSEHGLATPPLAQLEALFEDDMPEIDVDGFTIEAWVTWPEIPPGIRLDTDVSPLLAVGAPPMPPTPPASLVGLGIGRTGPHAWAYTTDCVQQNGTPHLRTPLRAVPVRSHLVFVHRYVPAEAFGCSPSSCGGTGTVTTRAVGNDVLYVDGVRYDDIDRDYQGSSGCNAVCVPAAGRPGCIDVSGPGRVLQIGTTFDPGTVTNFEGRIHLVAVYDEPLTDAEVLNNYLAGVDADPCTP